MKFTVEFTADNNSFALKTDLEGDFKTDAEGLGYLSIMLLEMSNSLTTFLGNANPNYHKRIANGMAFSILEKLKEKNDMYPFTTFIVRDE